MVVTLWKRNEHPVFDIYEYEYDVNFEKKFINTFKQLFEDDVEEHIKVNKILKVIRHLYYMTIVSLTELNNDLEMSPGRTNLTVHKLSSNISTLQSIVERHHFKMLVERNYLAVVLARVITTNYTIAKMKDEKKAAAIQDLINSIIEE